MFVAAYGPRRGARNGRLNVAPLLGENVVVVERTSEGEVVLKELLGKRTPKTACLEGQIIGSFLGGLVGGASLLPLGPFGMLGGAVNGRLAGALVGAKAG